YEVRRGQGVLVLRHRVEYFGFELERDEEVVEYWSEGEQAERAWAVLADALASGHARHNAARRNQEAVDEVREVWRRLGGRTPRLGQRELAELYAAALREQNVCSMPEFRAARLPFSTDSWVSAADMREAEALPDSATVREQEIPLQYDVE